MMINRRYGEAITIDTRSEANETVNKNLRYMQILEILHGAEMTAKEIAVEMRRKGYTPTDERNYAAPRLTELCRTGKVEPVGKKTCEYTGKTVAVYREVNND